MYSDINLIDFFNKKTPFYKIIVFNVYAVNFKNIIIKNKVRRIKMLNDTIKKLFSDAKSAVFENSLNTSQIEIISNKHAIIQGANNVLEYEKDLIRINLLNKEIQFLGEDFSIEYLTYDTIEVKGNIIRIEFI